MAVLRTDGRLLEHFIKVSLRADTHVLLPQSSCMGGQIGVLLMVASAKESLKQSLNEGTVPAALIRGLSGASLYAP